MRIVLDRRVLRLVLITAIVVTIIGFVIDLYNTIDYPGTDLRNRVVGARLMLEGIDPYFFKWQPELSERFYDPLDIPTELVSKLSVPPTVLVLHSIFAKLPYLTQKIIWLFVQWAAFIGTVSIFIKTSSSQTKTNLILIVAFLFANSLFWRFHVNSGQIYIVYIFLLSIAWLFLKQRFNLNLFWGGIFAGIAVSLRPSFILFFLAFIIGKKYLFVLGGALGAIFSVVLTLPVAGKLIWQRYILTMLGMTGFIDLRAYAPFEESHASNSNIVYPKITEGFDFSVRNPLESYLDNTSFYDILNAIDIPNKRYILVVGFAIAIILLSLYIWKFVCQNQNIELLFLWGIVTCIIGEFFIPVGRYSYYDIQMILPLLAAIDLANVKDSIYQKRLGILLLGLLLSIVGFIIVPRAMFFSVFLILSYIILISLMLTNQNNRATKRAWKT